MLKMVIHTLLRSVAMQMYKCGLHLIQRGFNWLADAIKHNRLTQIDINVITADYMQLMVTTNCFISFCRFQNEF